MPGTVPANTGTFGGLFGGKSLGVGGANTLSGGTRSAMGNRGGTWRNGPQSRSLDTDYYMDGHGVGGNPRSQLETVVEAGRGVRKLPAQPVGTTAYTQPVGTTAAPIQNQPGMIGPGMIGPHPTTTTVVNSMQNCIGMDASAPVNRFGIAGTAVTALGRMQQAVPNGTAVNVLHNPGVMPMDNGYGPPAGNMMDMGGGSQFQTELQGFPQQQQPTQHPSVQFAAQPEWT